MKGTDALLAEGYTVHVCTGEDGRPIKPPVFLRDLLAPLASKG
jgi:acyl-CoA thioesterase FadM